MENIMQIVSQEGALAVVQLNSGELRMIASAINEALEAVEEWEF